MVWSQTTQRDPSPSLCGPRAPTPTAPPLCQHRQKQEEEGDEDEEGIWGSHHFLLSCRHCSWRWSHQHLPAALNPSVTPAVHPGAASAEGTAGTGGTAGGSPGPQGPRVSQYT